MDNPAERPPPSGGFLATPDGRLRVWLGAALAFLILVWLLRGILLPFVAGMAIAYFLDPVAERLQRMGLSRTWATVVITLSFFLLFVIVLVLLAPIVGDQITAFVQRVPTYIHQLGQRAQPIWRALVGHLSPHDIDRLRNAAGDYAGNIAGWVGGVLGELVGGSLALANLLSLIFITPIVTFYLLRDWHRVTDLVEKWLPRRHEAEIRQLFHEVDMILAGFVRGQALVCLTLACIYGAGLTLVGLDLGLLVGLGAGMLSIVPYLGSITGFVVAVGLAVAQSSDWMLPAEAAVVFVVGNQIEANLLAPRLVGSRVGLHPVWIIFALLAGGALFGFLGLLLAVPSAAVIGVLARFLLARYLASPMYSGDGPEAGN